MAHHSKDFSRFLCLENTQEPAGMLANLTLWTPGVWGVVFDLLTHSHPLPVSSSTNSMSLSSVSYDPDILLLLLFVIVIKVRVTQNVLFSPVLKHPDE